MCNRKVAPSKIVCTIGPACDSEERLKELADKGMAIARINFSHGTEESHKKVIETINKVRSLPRYACIGIAVDTKGTEIRTGCFEKEVEVPAGSAVTITTDPAYQNRCTEKMIFVDHAGFIGDLERSGTNKVYIDDGKLELEVVSLDREGRKVHAKAVNSSRVSSRKGVNIPGASVSLPGITEKDRADIVLGAANGADFVFASFVRTKGNIEEIRCIPEAKHLKIIAKIESLEGLRNLEEIVEASDGVMVARGDLGIEADYASLFFYQCQIASVCLRQNKPYIVATQMLESLVEGVRPTRAEITDVGLACAMSAGCVMLSGETATGTNPSNVVSVMQSILVSTSEKFCTNPLAFPVLEMKNFPKSIKFVVSANKEYLRSIQILNGYIPVYAPPGSESESASEETLPTLPAGYAKEIVIHKTPALSESPLQ